MRFLIQVVTKAEVSILESLGETGSDGDIPVPASNRAIGRGLAVLIGVAADDDEAIADKMVDKLLKLRIFADGEGKTNLSLADINGSLMLVSQFTLYADLRRGNRPGFTYAASPDKAKALYDYVVKSCKEKVKQVETGEFGAYMHVSLTNDGPFTVMLDSDELNRPRNEK